jgi:hypothetical protein
MTKEQHKTLLDQIAAALLGWPDDGERRTLALSSSDTRRTDNRPLALALDVQRMHNDSYERERESQADRKAGLVDQEPDGRGRPLWQQSTTEALHDSRRESPSQAGSAPGMTKRSGPNLTDAQRSKLGYGRLTLRLPEHTLAQLAVLAHERGVTRAQLVASLVEAAANPGQRSK